MITYELYDNVLESVLFEREMDINEVNHANRKLRSNDSDARWIEKKKDETISSYCSCNAQFRWDCVCC